MFTTLEKDTQRVGNYFCFLWFAYDAEENLNFDNLLLYRIHFLSSTLSLPRDGQQQQKRQFS